MNDIDEQMEQMSIADPSTTDEIRNKGGRPKGSSKPKIDWYARREEIWDKMNDAIDGGAPAPAVIRALQSQLDTCNQAIANEADERRERQRIKELQKDNPSAVPPVPATATETERRMLKDLEEEERLKKLLKQLDGTAETPAPPSASAEELKAAAPHCAAVSSETEAELAKKDAAKKVADKAAEDEKKEANDQRLARIAELKADRDAILKNRTRPGFMQMAANNPTFIRDGNAGLKAIADELQRLEPAAVGNSTGADIEEIKAENRRVQKEYEKDYMFERSGGQITPPHNYGQFRD